MKTILKVQMNVLMKLTLFKLDFVNLQATKGLGNTKETWLPFCMSKQFVNTNVKTK